MDELKSYVPRLYNNRAVDGSWRELNWRLNGPDLEKTLLETNWTREFRRAL
jgi:hypothetical protein